MGITVDRKILFHRVRVIPDDDSRPFLADQAIAAVGRTRFLPDTSPASRYMDLGNGQLMCVWPRTTAGKLRIVMGTSRRSALPSLEELGNVSALPITQAQGLLEETHVVFFPRGIVGAEVNFYGPRLGRLAQFFSEKIPSFPKVRFDALLNRDADEELRNLEDIRLLRVAVRRDDTRILERASKHLPAALDAASRHAEAPIIEVVLRSEPHSRKPLGAGALDILKELVGMRTIHDAAQVVQARGVDARTGSVELFDFLADKFAFKRRVVKESDRSRSVNATDMFQQIEKVYNEHKEELENAAGVG